MQRKNSSMEISKKYQYVQNKGAKWQGIGLTKQAGFYQGVVYRYGKVTPIEEDDKLRLQFDWEILDSNGLGKEYFNDDFFNLIGDILYDIMEKQLEDGSLQYVNTDDRKNDTITLNT